MKYNVFIRKTDEQGRLVIPKSLRTRLGIGEDEQVEIIEAGDSFTVRRARPRCVFCRSENSLTEFMDQYICGECSVKINKQNNPVGL